LIVLFLAPVCYINTTKPLHWLAEVKVQTLCDGGNEHLIVTKDNNLCQVYRYWRSTIIVQKSTSKHHYFIIFCFNIFSRLLETIESRH